MGGALFSAAVSHDEWPTSSAWEPNQPSCSLHAACRRKTMKRNCGSDGRLDSTVAERAVYKSRVPADAIPHGVNFVLGGLAGFVNEFTHRLDNNL